MPTNSQALVGKTSLVNISSLCSKIYKYYCYVISHFLFTKYYHCQNSSLFRNYGNFTGHPMILLIMMPNMRSSRALRYSTDVKAYWGPCKNINELTARVIIIGLLFLSQECYMFYLIFVDLGNRRMDWKFEKRGKIIPSLYINIVKNVNFWASWKLFL